MNVLYLEDESNEAELVRRFFRSTPHQLTIAQTIEEAQKALDDFFDLILVDMRIGSTRYGFEFVRQLRRRGVIQPIVAVTGLTLPQDLEQCYKAGCSAVLTKPYKIEQLKELVEYFEEE